nr:hypothetical protein [Candidatus Woesearchaeota archaeon]
MTKLKLLAVGKSSKHNYYIFPKEQVFFKLARQLLDGLGFEKHDYSAFGIPIDKKWGEPIPNKEENIKNYIDSRYSFKNKEYYVDIIFGKEKIFLMIHTEKDEQQKLARLIKRLR